MKKFKIRRKFHKKTIFIIIIIVMLFTVLSFIKLNKSYDRVVSMLLSHFSNDKNLSLNVITSNLDYLFNNYSFKEKIVYNKRNKKIVLYNNLNNYDITNTTLNNLIKLGIDASIEDESNNIIDNNINYYIDIEKDDDETITNIKNKTYARILLVHGKDNKNDVIKMNNYLNNNYPNISRGIVEDDNLINTIKIKISTNNNDEINNSTEIIALMLYYVLGE